MARVAIRLSKDISTVIPLMGKGIEGCGTSIEPPGAAFRFKKYGVVVDPREITIFDADDPAIAREVIELLKKIETSGDTMTEKVKPY